MVWYAHKILKIFLLRFIMGFIKSAQHKVHIDDCIFICGHQQLRTKIWEEGPWNNMKVFPPPWEAPNQVCVRQRSPHITEQKPREISGEIWDVGRLEDAILWMYSVTHLSTDLTKPQSKSPHARKMFENPRVIEQAKNQERLRTLWRRKVKGLNTTWHHFSVLHWCTLWCCYRHTQNWGRRSQLAYMWTLGQHCPCCGQIVAERKIFSMCSVGSVG